MCTTNLSLPDKVGINQIRQLVFQSLYKGGEVKIDPYEHSEFRWATPDEALTLISDESIKRAIQTLKDCLVK